MHKRLSDRLALRDLIYPILEDCVGGGFPPPPDLATEPPRISLVIRWHTSVISSNSGPAVDISLDVMGKWRRRAMCDIVHAIAKMLVGSAPKNRWVSRLRSDRPIT